MFIYHSLFQLMFIYSYSNFSFIQLVHCLDVWVFFSLSIVSILAAMACRASSKAPAEQPRPKRFKGGPFSEGPPPILDQKTNPDMQPIWSSLVKMTSSWFFAEAVQLDVHKNEFKGDELTNLINTFFSLLTIDQQVASYEQLSL